MTLIDINNVPDFQDEVKHKHQSDYIGIVIAKYGVLKTGEKWKWDPFNFAQGKIPVESIEAIEFDVRLSNDTIVYGTDAMNWETIRTEEQRWE